jgi:hypothetical protein
MTGSRYGISIDGRTRTNRDIWEISIEAANMLKKQNPHSRVDILDHVTGVTTEIECQQLGIAKTR